jgi:hypothetical protein
MNRFKSRLLFFTTGWYGLRGFHSGLENIKSSTSLKFSPRRTSTFALQFKVYISHGNNKRRQVWRSSTPKALQKLKTQLLKKCKVGKMKRTVEGVFF